jgi:aminopeptidase N
MLTRIFFLISGILFLMNFEVLSQTTVPVENGVSQQLARWRAANYSNVRYKLNITLEKGAPLMKGDLEIAITLTDAGAKNDLILDWRTTQFAGDKDKPYANVIAANNTIDIISTVVNEHLIVPKGALKSGENIIKIQFASPIKTSGAAVTRYLDKEDGGEYIYSLFVPSDASTAFPCFDQPDLKARFDLNITVPNDWTVVTNTDVMAQGDVKCSHCEPGYIGQKILLFRRTEPISTYVFAFAAGNFYTFKECLYNDEFKGQAKVKCLDLSGSEYPQKRDHSNIYVRRSQSEKFKQHAAEVFRLNREGLKFLSSYFDYPYPFPKYDLVLIPEFPFGGMEHAGATFLREDSIIFPQEPTANNYISRANVIFHEAAHQWFGDTVTMRWFDDLWLKEGFAEFMAYKTLEKVMPEYNAWKVFYERNKQAAYLTDSTKGTTAIYQPIENLSAAKSAYGNIVYRKAPSFLRQAEFYLGPDKFQTAVRAFLKKHEFANAGWEDLVKEFELSSSQNLQAWADVWVKKRGMPIFKMEIENRKDLGKLMGTPVDVKLVFSQESSLLKDVTWPEKLQFYYVYKSGKTRVETIKLNKGDGKIEELWGVNNPGSETNESRKEMSPPKFIFTNYQDYGYGIFLMDDKSKKYALENIQNEKDDFLRAMMWGSLWDSVREGELDPASYVELVIKNLGVTTPSREARASTPSKRGELDETTISVLLGRVSTAMNYYLAEKQKAALAPRVENLLIDKLKNSSPLGLRLTYYRSFLGIASTERARGILKHVLMGELSANDFRGDGSNSTNDSASGSGSLPDNYVVDQIPLKTKDKFDIVTRLLILGDKEAPALLAELEKTETNDEAKRYAYAARAGIGTAENKAKYFGDFLNNKNISESWIEAAAGPFNSVRQSDLTLPFLQKALAELPNLKRNRKIFFINGWLGAFIGGQHSGAALSVVNKFLADNPNLDRDLRLKILENADGLERAVKIRAKFGGN